MAIDLWLIPEPDIPLQRMLAFSAGLLSADERQRFDSQRLPKGQFTFLHTRIALRMLLSRYWPAIEPRAWRFQRSAHGKPYICAPQSVAPLAGSYNLTHADGMLAIAVCADGEVGVDIEPQLREVDALALAKRFFSDEEYQLLSRCEPALRQSHFLEIWTLKEACVKACGMGLAHALRHFSFEPHGLDGLVMKLHASRQSSPAAAAGYWQVWSGVHGAYRLGLACQNREPVTSSRALTVRGFSVISGESPVSWQQQGTATA